MGIKSELEETMRLQIIANGLPAPTEEFRFHPTRRWRFDFAWPDLKVALEVEGGVYTHGKQGHRFNSRTNRFEVATKKSRHLTPAGFREDCIKYGEAAVYGWLVYRACAQLINNGQAIKTVKKIIENRGINETV